MGTLNATPRASKEVQPRLVAMNTEQQAPITQPVLYRMTRPLIMCR
jgi:hypothetical protein